MSLYSALVSNLFLFQVLDSLPNVKFDGLSDRFSRTSLTEVFGGLGLAEVHGPKLPKPDLGKISEQLTCLQAQLSLKGGKVEGKMRRRRRGWCGSLTGPDDPPEITYCVADNAGGGLSLQALTPTTPMPDEAELNEKFAELVVSTKDLISMTKGSSCSYESYARPA